MARFNEILVGRYNRFLQKFLAMKGAAPAPQLASDLSATWAMFHGAENRYLEGWERFGVFANVAAVAAVFGQIQLRNPTGSNVIAVVEKAYLVGKASDTPILEIGANTTDRTVGTPTRFDPRGRGSGTIIPSQGTAATGPTGLTTLFAGNTTSTTNTEAITTDIHEFPLLPGDVVNWRSQLANTAFSGGFWWRERFLEDSERT